MSWDVLVVGGGVNGLLTALGLARTGRRVCLLERQALGRESSWAGGGIVSPLYPWRYPPAISALASWGQHYYPRLAEQLLRLTAVDAEVFVSGLYWLDLPDEAELKGWACEQGVELELFAGGELRNRLPALAHDYLQALYCPALANVRNPRLLKALKLAVLKQPSLVVQENTSVNRFLLGCSGIRGVETKAGPLLADKVVLTAGAWSGELLAKLGLHLPVEPVKGQMILYKCEPDYLSAMVLAEGRYAIPRRDGHVLVGSTLEHVGFDKAPTGDALASLKASAEKMLPGLAQREVVGHWAGLRPGSPDGIPFIGEVPELPGLWLNCGHYRNGLVLAPASCELLKNLMLGETPIVDPAPYSPSGRLRAL